MPRVISDTHTLITGNPGAPERVPPGKPVSVSKADADGLVLRGIARLVDDQPAAENTEKVSAGTGEPMQEVEGNELDTRVNLNTATAAEISKAINGVGKKTAGDIIAWRKKLDGFKSLEQVAEVGGVSLEQLEAADVTV